MKRISILALAAFAFSLLSCEKTSRPTTSDENIKTIEKEFAVNADETKTSLDGVSIVWSSTDVITVKAATTGNEYDFSFKSGSGTSAVFSGTINEVDKDETVFYAVYPNYKKNEISGNLVKVSNAALGHTVKAVKGSFDPAFAVMAAKSENSGAFNFKHGMAYFKIQIDQAGISNVRIAISGDGRIYGRPNVDVTSSASTTMDKGKSGENYIDMQPETGTIETGIYYIPVTVKSSSIGDLTVTYTKGGATSQLTTSAKSSVKLAAGKIYDLGCPPISFDPTINPTAPSKLAFDAESGSFTFTIANATTATPSVTITDGTTWLSNAAVTGPDGDGKYTVTFGCTKNNEASATERTGKITISYTGATDVPVTITQGIEGGTSSTVEEYDWNFTEWYMETVTGVSSNTSFSTTFTKDGLTYIANGSKWNTSSNLNYIQTGGKNSKTTTTDIDNAGRVFKFTTLSEGTITITASNTGNNTARKLSIKVDDNDAIPQSQDGVTSTTPVTITFSNVPAGTIRLFSADDSVRIFRIQFTNQ